MWQIRKTDLQIYIAVNVGLHFAQRQTTDFSRTYEIFVDKLLSKIAIYY
jgi:hypothetical protein